MKTFIKIPEVEVILTKPLKSIIGNEESLAKEGVQKQVEFTKHELEILRKLNEIKSEESHDEIKTKK